MKKLTLIVTLFVAFTLAACKKNPATPVVNAKPLKEAIIGKWKWIKNEGQFLDSHNAWLKVREENYSSRNCYLEYKAGGNGLEHFVNLNTTISDRNFIWSIIDEKTFLFKPEDNVQTFKYTILYIDEHELIYASEGLLDSSGQMVRSVFYLTK